MGIIDGTFEFPLSANVPYADRGQMKEATFVLFSEPKGQHAALALRLKQMFMSAVPKLAALAKDMEGIREDVANVVELKKPHEVDDQKVETELGEMLLMLEGFDVEGFLDSFRRLVTSNSKGSVAKLNGDQVFTDSIWDNVLPEDQLNMAAAFVNFMQARSAARKSGSGNGFGSQSQVKVL